MFSRADELAYAYRLGLEQGREEGYVAGRRAAHDEVFSEWVEGLDDTGPHTPFPAAQARPADRTHFTATQSLTPAQIRAQAFASWGIVDDVAG